MRLLLMSAEISVPQAALRNPHLCPDVSLETGDHRLVFVLAKANLEQRCLKPSAPNPEP